MADTKTAVSSGDSHSDAVEVVRAFIARMHEWELAANAASKAARKTDNPTSYQRPILASMNTVFAKWCTPKERKHGRLGAFSNPPEYQPNHEPVLKVVLESPRRA